MKTKRSCEGSTAIICTRSGRAWKRAIQQPSDTGWLFSAAKCASGKCNTVLVTILQAALHRFPAPTELFFCRPTQPSRLRANSR